MANNLGDLINVTRRTVDKELMNRWLSIKLLLKLHHITGYKDCTALDAIKYKHDFWGLFRNVFKIQEELVYPHLIANDFNAWTDYDGIQTRFKMLNTDALLRYYGLFIMEKPYQPKS